MEATVPMPPLSPALSRDPAPPGIVLEVFEALDRPFDAAFVQALISGLTPGFVAGLTWHLFVVVLIGCVLLAFFGIRLSVPPLFPRSVVILSAALAAAALGGLAPLSALIVVTPLVLHWAVAAGTVPGALVHAALRSGRSALERITMRVTS